MTYKAFRIEDNTEVKRDDTILANNNDVYKFLYVTSKELIYATRLGMEFGREFYPSVFNLRVQRFN